ncbi:MAG: leukotoxin LktA family filamentous adhesin, partial [Cyanobacteriota bacterium]
MKKASIFIYYVLATLLLCCNCALCQQIVTDGNTKTTLNINNNTTDVTTTTLKGDNAYNSFIKFNVNQGNTVNVHVPSQSKNLINLVHSEKTVIDGTLNSIKNNQVGGNVFLVNPHGITIGTQGKVNVGSLTAVTPTKEYMNSFFDSPENPSESATSELINGKVPVNSDATITIDGQINAIESVKLDTGSLQGTGEINAGPAARDNIIQTNDIVNTGELPNTSDLAIFEGNIVIQAEQNIEVAGKISSRGSDNINGGRISITSNNDISVISDANISSKGSGKNSNAGDIYIFADNNALIKDNAIVDARGGEISGNGGFIEFSAGNSVEITGGEFKAGSVNGTPGEVLVDPLNISIGQALSDGVDMSFVAADAIIVNPNAIVSTRNLLTSATGENVSGEDHAAGISQGNSGNIIFNAPGFQMKNDSQIYTFANNGYNSGNITIITNSIDLTNVGVFIDTSGGDFTLTRKTLGDLYVSNGAKGDGRLRIYTSELAKISSENLYLGDPVPASNLVNDLYIYSSVNIPNNLIMTSKYNASPQDWVTLTVGGDFKITAGYTSDSYYDVYIGDDTTVNVGGNFWLEAPYVVFDSRSVSTADNFDILASTRLINFDDSKITALNDIRIIPSDIDFDTVAANTFVKSTNGNIIISKPQSGNFYLGDQGILNPNEIQNFEAVNLIFGNHVSTNNNTNNLYLSKDVVLTGNTNLIINVNNNIIGSNSSISTAGNITLTATNGKIGTPTHYFNINEGVTSSLNATAAGEIYLKEIDGDMRIDIIQSTSNSDVYLSSVNGNIIDATATAQDNIIAGNLFIKDIQYAKNYYYVGIVANGNSTENRDGSMNYFLDLLKANGENWDKAFDDNIIILDNSQMDLYERDVLGILENIANRMGNNDVFMINYHGHGGDGADRTPIDENNGRALTTNEEYLALYVRPGQPYDYVYAIYDDELALSLKDSSGTVVLVSSNCQGGMFEGENDLDTIANANGFKYFGILGAKEGEDGWRSNFTGSDAHVYSMSHIYQNLIRTIDPGVNPNFWTNYETSTLPSQGEWITLSQAFNADGNVYLDEWFTETKGGRSEYWVWSASSPPTIHEEFTSFTNMTAGELSAEPIIDEFWNHNIITNTIPGIGTPADSLTVNLTQNFEGLTTNLTNLSGNISGDLNLTSSSTATINGSFAGQINIQANGNIDITQNSGNLTLSNILSTTGNVNVLNSAGHTYIDLISASNVLIDNQGAAGVSNIVINPGGVITATSAGNTIILNSANSNFINNAGATALSSPAGRWIIYSEHPDNTTEGGLIFNKLYGKNYIANPPGTIPAGNFILYSITPTIIITADNKSRLYGNVNPSLTYTITGLIGGDTEATALSGIPDISTVATNLSDAGNYIINSSVGTLISNYGYLLSFANGTLTINKAPLTVDIDDKTRFYADANPLFTAIYTGFKLGQDETVLTGSISTAATNASNAGNYAITSNYTASNY